MQQQTPSTVPAERCGWTVAFRKPTANRFRRVSGLDLSWHEANELGTALADRMPGRQFWVTTTAEYDQAHPGDPDAYNVLTDTGKRVRVVETGERVDAVTELALTTWLDELNSRIRAWGATGDTMTQLAELLVRRTSAELLLFG